MNLLNLKKAACMTGILFVALYAQQALAWDDPYLYCSSQNKASWSWAKTADQPLNNELNIGYNEGLFSRLQGFYPTGMYPQAELPKDLFMINTLLKDNTMRNEKQAKSVCKELQKFCPGKDPEKHEIYLGAARYSTSKANSIGLYFKNDPSDQSEEPSILLCPSWKHEPEKTTHNCGLIFGPLDKNTGRLYERKVTSAGLGACAPS